MAMDILASGSDGGKAWFLVGAAETGRLFLVIRHRGSGAEVRWFLPNHPWNHFEPASAIEAEAAAAAVLNEPAGDSLGWNDMETATRIYETYRGAHGGRAH